MFIIIKMKEKRAKSFCSLLYDIAIKFDFFGYLLDKRRLDGLSLYRSLVGTLASLTFFVVLMLYASYTYNSMRLYNDTNVMTSNYENYYTEDDVFPS